MQLSDCYMCCWQLHVELHTTLSLHCTGTRIKQDTTLQTTTVQTAFRRLGQVKRTMQKTVATDTYNSSSSSRQYETLKREAHSNIRMCTHVTAFATLHTDYATGRRLSTESVHWERLHFLNSEPGLPQYQLGPPGKA